jgi:hypothetical protein
MTRDLSSYWTGNAAARIDGRSDTHRLAVVLGMVRSVVRVIDSRTPRMEVDWAAVGSDDAGHPLSQSYTDFRGGRMALNPLPILDGKLDAATQVDVSIGQALHEASHSVHLRDIWYSTLLRPRDTIRDGAIGPAELPVFEPMRLAVWLLNVAADAHDEGATAAEWPGFAGYFEVLLDWLWGEVDRGATMAEESALGDALRTAFMGVRFHGRSPATTPQEAAEQDWWRGWADDYATGRLSPSETVRDGLDRLRQNPAVASEMAEMTIKDAEERKAGEDLRRLIERLAEEGVAGLRACSGLLAEQSLLDEAESETVRRLVAEHLEDVPVIVPHRGSKAPRISLRRPLEDVESRQEYVGRPSASVEAMRAALVFRPARPQHDQKLRRSGEMDDEELWRVGTGDFRVFTERVVEARPDTALGMLVDISGSMAGRKLDNAQRLAQTLLLAAMDSEGVTPYVWAHTGDLEDGASAEVYTIFEPGDPATRLGLLGSLDNGDNYDSFAEQVVIDRLRQMDQEQKVLIVLNDGAPAGQGYGGPAAHRHVRETVRWGQSVGVTVISIAVDGGLSAAEQATMYDQWVPYHDDRQVARDLTAILSRLVR